ncbi:hypothetical protein SK128_016247, partial [Halocaridina rubra]
MHSAFNILLKGIKYEYKIKYSSNVEVEFTVVQQRGIDIFHSMHMILWSTYIKKMMTQLCILMFVALTWAPSLQFINRLTSSAWMFLFIQSCLYHGLGLRNPEKS